MPQPFFSSATDTTIRPPRNSRRLKFTELSQLTTLKGGLPPPFSAGPSKKVARKQMLTGPKKELDDLTFEGDPGRGLVTRAAYAVRSGSADRAIRRLF